MVLWEFNVREGMEKPFEEAYGPEGTWAQFFARDSAYLGTELLRDPQHRGRYVIVDVWRSEAAYEAFREKWLAEYRALDKSFEALTERETRLGSFHSVGRSKLLARWQDRV